MAGSKDALIPPSPLLSLPFPTPSLSFYCSKPRYKISQCEMFYNKKGGAKFPPPSPFPITMKSAEPNHFHFYGIHVKKNFSYLNKKDI